MCFFLPVACVSCCGEGVLPTTLARPRIQPGVAWLFAEDPRDRYSVPKISPVSKLLLTTCKLISRFTIVALNAVKKIVCSVTRKRWIHRTQAGAASRVAFLVHAFSVVPLGQSPFTCRRTVWMGLHWWRSLWCGAPNVILFIFYCCCSANIY